MHRDALATLGESLWREFQDLLHDDATVLTDLVEDAQQLLESLDRQFQALAAWLTASSVSAALPLVASIPIEEADAVPPTSWQPNAPPILSVQVARRPSADSGTRALLDVPRDVTGLRGGLPFAEPTPDADGATGTSTYSHAPPASHAHPASDAAAPTGVAATRSYPVWRDPDLYIQQATPSGPSPLNSSTRGELTAPRMAVANSAPAPRVDAAVAPMEALRGEADHSPFAPALPDAGVPLPTAMGTFTPVKNLQDLAQLLSPTDYAASSVETAVTASSDAAESDAAGAAAPGGARRSAQADAWCPATFLAPEDAPSRLPQWQEQAPAQPPPSVAPANSVRQDTLPGGNTADAGAAIPPQEEAPEVDVESLLDTLARSVAEEYRRFYGS